jgi:hypothetical protein
MQTELVYPRLPLTIFAAVSVVQRAHPRDWLTRFL